MNESEVGEFVHAKALEMELDIPQDARSINLIHNASGGLPLAIQWMLGQYKVTHNLAGAADAVRNPGSPVLEFSFRNVWNVLSRNAKELLAIMSIFDSPPSIQEIAVATVWRVDRIEEALSELADATLVTRVFQSSVGRYTFVTLPITLAFASNELSSMGDFEVRCRQRLQQFHDQMQLHDFEIVRFGSVFDKFGLTTDNERRAAVLCQRGERDVFAGNIDLAEGLFRQARELAPHHAYVLSMAASFELARGSVGRAGEFAREACARATQRTGALAHRIHANVLDAQRDKLGRVQALNKALSYDHTDVILRHQYGVALSRAGRTEEAIHQFDLIIASELKRVPLTATVLMALKTRVINNRRLGRTIEVEQDLTLAQQLIAENPHLQSQAEEIAELLED
jgi:tetratricopeptide (TPR) repeat protein